MAPTLLELQHMDHLMTHDGPLLTRRRLTLHPFSVLVVVFAAGFGVACSGPDGRDDLGENPSLDASRADGAAAPMPAPSKAPAGDATEATDAGAKPNAGDAAPAQQGTSAQGLKQMADVLAYAEKNNSGASKGRCFEYVWKYLTTSGYGSLDDYTDAPDMPSAYARNFAEYMNANGNAAKWGLRRLPLDVPHDAPPGAVVVVAAGSPGTSHPTAGDIAIAAGGGRFVNDGPNMSYGPRAAFKSNGGRVLGIYAPL